MESGEGLVEVEGEWWWSESQVALARGWAVVWLWIPDFPRHAAPPGAPNKPSARQGTPKAVNRTRAYRKYVSPRCGKNVDERFAVAECSEVVIHSCAWLGLQGLRLPDSRASSTSTTSSSSRAVETVLSWLAHWPWASKVTVGWRWS